MAQISIPSGIGGVNIPGPIGSALSGPLSALYKGNGPLNGDSGIPSYKYPMDLATDPTKSHYIQFTIRKVKPASYNTSGTNATGVQGKTINLPNAQNIVANTINSTNQELSQANLINSEYSSTLNTVSDYIKTAKLQITPNTTKTVGIVNLYMPDTIETNYESSWSTLDLKDMSTFSTLRAIDEIAGKSKDVKSGTIQSTLLNVIANDPAVTYLASKTKSTETLGNLLLKGQGYAINPQTQMLYNGIQLRDFTLNFTLSPKSRDEAVQISGLVNMLKYHSLPSLQKTTDDASISMFLVQPSIFNIGFYSNNKENANLPKYGDCVLISISHDFTPNGWAAYDDGMPVQTKLSLHFRELEIVTRESMTNTDASKIRR